MTIENRKEYLDGILDKISVTLDKNQQHQLSIWFKYPIVGDSHEWDDPKKTIERLPNPRRCEFVAADFYELSKQV